MFTKKQLRGIIFCGIAVLSLIFALVCFLAFSAPFGFLFILAALTYAAIGLLDMIPNPEPQTRRPVQAPNRNIPPQAGQAPTQNGFYNQQH